MMMWLYVDYAPVAAFGLRPSNTTASGGKSLICPTPYAIKMALLDRLIRAEGEAAGRAWFPYIRDLTIYLRIPMGVAVNRTFQKVLRPGDKTKVWTNTIAQREFCFHAGEMTLAMALADDDQIGQGLRMLFPMINYFGRRGGFFQWVGDRLSDTPPTSEDHFVHASRGASLSLNLGFLQRMDDMLATATFDDVSVLNLRANGGRSSYTVVFPYVLQYHGAGYTVYERRGAS